MEVVLFDLLAQGKEAVRGVTGGAGEKARPQKGRRSGIQKERSSFGEGRSSFAFELGAKVFPLR